MKNLTFLLLFFCVTVSSAAIAQESEPNDEPVEMPVLSLEHLEGDKLIKINIDFTF